MWILVHLRTFRNIQKAPNVEIKRLRIIGELSFLMFSHVFLSDIMCRHGCRRLAAGGKQHVRSLLFLCSQWGGKNTNK